MTNYTDPSKDLLKHIGGKENILAVTHCVTRMRFVLNDPSKADVKEIESIKLVKVPLPKLDNSKSSLGTKFLVFIMNLSKLLVWMALLKKKQK